MASPFTVGMGSAANSPAAMSSGWAAPEENEGFSTRLMLLKVLYSFDDENKTNCLARWPHPINAQVVCVDGSTLIGVVDLKTCIETIITASPELVARLGKDYTIYAYDYSEYETPQVGQGMLSRALAASSGHSEAATESTAMVTGRVCTNMIGLFANGLKETLEVKLRLVPVPTAVQDEYANSMDKFRQMSRNGAPPNVDMNAWMNFVKTNPGVSQLLGNNMSPTVHAPSPAVHAPSPASQAQSPAPFSSMESNSMDSRGINAPSPASVVLSRTSTPIHSQPPPSQLTNFTNNNSRPSSRPTSRQGSMDASNLIAPVPLRPQYQENEENQLPEDDGPVRKRAKIAKADWNGRPTFGQSAPSLRVAASEAASIRLVRPLGGVALAAAQDSPRPPTPRVPHTNSRQSKPALSVQTSRRRESLNSANINSPLPPAHLESYEEAAPSSPADRWSQPLVNSPIDIASSPPCQDAASPGLPQPSSPVLPQLPRSGIYNSQLHSDLQSDDFDRPLDDDELVLPKKAPRSRKSRAGSKSVQSDGMMFQEETPGPAEQLPTKILPRTSEAQRKRTLKANSVDPHPSSDGAQVSLKRLQPKFDGTMRLNAVLPLPRRGSFLSDKQLDSSLSTRSDKSENLKRRVQVRLHDAIEKGEMPPYCENCGAIETPTWRRAFTKIVDETDPEAIQKAQAEGAENPERRRIVKKNLDEGDEGFTSVLLCNPCGLWSTKTGEFRPHTYWDKTQRLAAPPRRRLSRNKRKKTSGGFEPTSELNLQSEAMMGTDDEASPPIAEEGNSPEKEVELARAEDAILKAFSFSEPALPANESAEQALRRALQSSPVRFMGAANSPIDVDALGSTRRLLFPSPRKSGITKSLDPAAETAAATATPTSTSESPTTHPGAAVADDETTEKENDPPSGRAEDEISRLFAIPQTPSRLVEQPKGNQHKTPAQPVPPSPWTALLSSAQRAPVEASPISKQLSQIMSEHAFPEEDAALFSGFGGDHTFQGEHGGFDFDNFTFEDSHGDVDSQQLQLQDMDASFLESLQMPATGASDAAPAVMPSSPPTGQFFTVFEDPVDWEKALAQIEEAQEGLQDVINNEMQIDVSAEMSKMPVLATTVSSSTIATLPALIATSSSPDAVPKTDEVDIVPTMQFPDDAERERNDGKDSGKTEVERAAATVAGTPKYSLPLVTPDSKLDGISPGDNGAVKVVGDGDGTGDHGEVM